MKNFEIQRMQQALLEMMKELHLVLMNNGIDYFISDGTLLGAVRHKGFIPWDDDIDISMTRDNYNDFIRISDSILPQHLKFITHEKDEKYPYLFGKIYNVNTTLIEANNKTYVGGVYIDVFPLDSIVENEKLQTKAVKKINNLKRVLRLRNNYYFGSKLRIMLLKIYSIPLKVFYTNRKIIKKVQRYIDHYSSVDSNKHINYFGAYGCKQIYTKEMMSRLIQLDFEKIKVFVIENYNDLLTMTYGNYMEMPPIHKRKSHHVIYYVDFDMPYCKYQKNVIGERRL